MAKSSSHDSGVVLQWGRPPVVEVGRLTGMAKSSSRDSVEM